MAVAAVVALGQDIEGICDPHLGGSVMFKCWLEHAT
jgi:hypothetical protein